MGASGPKNPGDLILRKSWRSVYLSRADALILVNEVPLSDATLYYGQSINDKPCLR